LAYYSKHSDPRIPAHPQVRSPPASPGRGRPRPAQRPARRAPGPGHPDSRAAGAGRECPKQVTSLRCWIKEGWMFVLAGQTAARRLRARGSEGTSACRSLYCFSRGACRMAAGIDSESNNFMRFCSIRPSSRKSILGFQEIIRASGRRFSCFAHRPPQQGVPTRSDGTPGPLRASILGIDLAPRPGDLTGHDGRAGWMDGQAAGSTRENRDRRCDRATGPSAAAFPSGQGRREPATAPETERPPPGRISRGQAPRTAA
jgi:hypothetical protein